ASAGFLALWGFVPPGWDRAAVAGPTLRLLTCNVQFGDLKVGALADLIREARPDLVLLQEWGREDPGEVLGPGGWNVRTEGEFCLASRLPIISFSILRRPDEPHRAFAARGE